MRVTSVQSLVPYIFKDTKSLSYFIDEHNLLRDEYLLFLI